MACSDIIKTDPSGGRVFRSGVFLNVRRGKIARAILENRVYSAAASSIRLVIAVIASLLLLCFMAEIYLSLCS